MCPFLPILLLLYISFFKHIYINIKTICLNLNNFEVDKYISTLSPLYKQFRCQFLPSGIDILSTNIYWEPPKGSPREERTVRRLSLYPQELTARAGKLWFPGLVPAHQTLTNKVLLEHSHPRSLTYCLWLLSDHDGRAEWFQHKPYGPLSLMTYYLTSCITSLLSAGLVQQKIHTRKHQGRGAAEGEDRRASRLRKLKVASQTLWHLNGVLRKDLEFSREGRTF